MTFCYVPPGKFLTGSPMDDSDGKPIEAQLEVTLNRGYWMARTETTQAQWRAIMGTTVAEQKAKGDDSGTVTGTGDYHPVYFVNWEEANEFAGKLTDRLAADGLLAEAWTLQLPTEAEWEFACRAGTTGIYNVGGASVTELAWIDDNSGSTTHTVAGKRPNALGLHDMHGNVSELCQDWYQDDIGAETLSAPRSSASVTDRVNRGGSWNDTEDYSRSDFRGRLDPSTRSAFVGFRLAAVPPYETFIEVRRSDGTPEVGSEVYILLDNGEPSQVVETNSDGVALVLFRRTPGRKGRIFLNGEVAYGGGIPLRIAFKR